MSHREGVIIKRSATLMIYFNLNDNKEEENPR